MNVLPVEFLSYATEAKLNSDSDGELNSLSFSTLYFQHAVLAYI